MRPSYDRDRRELRIRGIVVKCFTQESDAQEIILAEDLGQSGVLTATGFPAGRAGDQLRPLARDVTSQLPPAHSDPSSVARNATPGCRAEACLAGLLRAHENGCSLGQFLLTEAGVSYVRQWLLACGAAQKEQPSASPARRAFPPSDSVPYWDAKARQLWLGGVVLKQFRQPALNQTRLLGAFQEQGWEAHLDDPLWRVAEEEDEDAKRRLNETIKNLNRGLPRGTIRFRGDGTGQGVRWEHDRRQPGET